MATKAERMAKRGTVPVGRPPKTIDYALAKKMAQVGCTYEECSHLLGCSVSFLEKDEKFKRLHNENYTTAKMSLRRVQLKAAQKGNVAAQIWLGKNWLKQRDTPPEDAATDLPPVKVEIVFKDARKGAGNTNHEEQDE